MIKHKDISSFFDLEAEAEAKRWGALMDLSIEERIHKRKAIKSLYLDREFSGREENYIHYKLLVSENLSDFKEGERVRLHKEGDYSGIKATINRFEDEDIIIEVYLAEIPSDLETYYDTPLYLDKDLVDLREHVYNPFLIKLSSDDEYWKSSVINTRNKSEIQITKEIVDELDDTITNFNLNLLPRQREAILNSMASDDYYLIQGPPGTGKSYVLSYIILEEVAYFNRKVIVIGPNHMAINNALIQLLKNKCAISIKVGQSYNAPNFSTLIDGEECRISNIHRLDSFAANHSEKPWVIGTTPHCLYTSRARGLECDTLIIDEAGQMTIPLALMGMIKAKKIIFAGDYKQLPPIVSSDNIKDELKQSIFQAIITPNNCTMLDVSFRMCEPICNFVSDLFYDGDLKPYKTGCGKAIINDDSLYSFDSPIILCNTEDEGKQVSDREAEKITSIISRYLQLGLPANEIAVLSPFRAQAANVRRHIRKDKSIKDEDRGLLAVDTIDKMQGQEREVIIFSLVAGDIDYMNEMADFLYNPNKMNVAFSRAKSKLIIVGNLTNLEKIDLASYPHINKMLQSAYAHRE